MSIDIKTSIISILTTKPWQTSTELAAAIGKMRAKNSHYGPVSGTIRLFRGERMAYKTLIVLKSPYDTISDHLSGMMEDGLVTTRTRFPGPDDHILTPDKVEYALT